MPELLISPDITYTNSFLSQANSCNLFSNILFLNIRSLRLKLLDLSDYVQVSSLKHDVVVLNETRLNDCEAKYFNLPGFSAFHATRKKLGGGASIFVKQSFSGANLLESFEFENSNFLVVHLDRHNITIVTIYRPPDSNVQSFLTKLEVVLAKYKNAFIFGDFNINLFNASDSSVKKYVHVVNFNNFCFLNSREPHMYTRLNPLRNTVSCIDHIFTDMFTDFRFEFLVESILEVDHRALLVRIFKHNPYVPKSLGKVVSIHTINHQKIIDNNLLVNLSSDSFGCLIKNFNEVLANNSNSVTFKERFRKPFLTKEIYAYMQIRQNYYKCAKRYPNCDRVVYG